MADQTIAVKSKPNSKCSSLIASNISSLSSSTSPSSSSSSSSPNNSSNLLNCRQIAPKLMIQKSAISTDSHDRKSKCKSIVSKSNTINGNNGSSQSQSPSPTLTPSPSPPSSSSAASSPSSSSLKSALLIKPVLAFGSRHNRYRNECKFVTFKNLVNSTDSNITQPTATITTTTLSKGARMITMRTTTATATITMTSMTASTSAIGTSTNTTTTTNATATTSATTSSSESTVTINEQNVGETMMTSPNIDGLILSNGPIGTIVTNGSIGPNLPLGSVIQLTQVSSTNNVFATINQSNNNNVESNQQQQHSLQMKKRNRRQPSQLSLNYKKPTPTLATKRISTPAKKPQPKRVCNNNNRRFSGKLATMIPTTTMMTTSIATSPQSSTISLNMSDTNSSNNNGSNCGIAFPSSGILNLPQATSMNGVQMLPISSSIVTTKNGGQIAVLWMPSPNGGLKPTAFALNGNQISFLPMLTSSASAAAASSQPISLPTMINNSGNPPLIIQSKLSSPTTTTSTMAPTILATIPKPLFNINSTGNTIVTAGTNVGPFITGNQMMGVNTLVTNLNGLPSNTFEPNSVLSFNGQLKQSLSSAIVNDVVEYYDGGNPIKINGPISMDGPMTNGQMENHDSKMDDLDMEPTFYPILTNVKSSKILVSMNGTNISPLNQPQVPTQLQQLQQLQPPLPPPQQAPQQQQQQQQQQHQRKSRNILDDFMETNQTAGLLLGNNDPNLNSTTIIPNSTMEQYLPIDSVNLINGTNGDTMDYSSSDSGSGSLPLNEHLSYGFDNMRYDDFSLELLSSLIDNDDIGNRDDFPINDLNFVDHVLSSLETEPYSWAPTNTTTTIPAPQTMLTQSIDDDLSKIPISMAILDAIETTTKSLAKVGGNGFSTSNSLTTMTPTLSSLLMSPIIGSSSFFSSSSPSSLSSSSSTCSYSSTSPSPGISSTTISPIPSRTSIQQQHQQHQYHSQHQHPQFKTSNDNSLLKSILTAPIITERDQTSIYDNTKLHSSMINEDIKILPLLSTIGNNGMIITTATGTETCPNVTLNPNQLNLSRNDAIKSEDQ